MTTDIDKFYEAHRKLYKAYLDLLKEMEGKDKAIPDGMVLVPVEPTEEMIDEAADAYHSAVEAVKDKFKQPEYVEAGLTYRGPCPADWISKVYKAMIAARGSDER